MDSWRLDEDWERAGHCCMLALLTSITLHLLEAPAAARTVEQEQDELQASSQAAALSPSSARAEGLPREGCHWNGHRKRPAQFVTTLLPAPECFLEDPKDRFVQSPYISLAKN